MPRLFRDYSRILLGKFHDYSSIILGLFHAIKQVHILQQLTFLINRYVLRNTPCFKE